MFGKWLCCGDCSSLSGCGVGKLTAPFTEGQGLIHKLVLCLLGGTSEPPGKKICCPVRTRQHSFLKSVYTSDFSCSRRSSIL